MKKQDFAEVKKMDIKELAQKAKAYHAEVAKLLLDKSTGKLTDTKLAFKKRKELAKILTVLNQKQMLKNLEVQNG